MIRIGSDTDIGMNRNSSNWLGMNFNPILSPGLCLMRDKTLFHMKKVLNLQQIILFLYLYFQNMKKVTNNIAYTSPIF